METKDKKDQVRDADYDGIQEYDNNLPHWWLVTFFLTIAVAYVYWTRYHVLENAPTQADELALDLKKLQEEADKKESGKPFSNEDMFALVKDSNVVTKGQGHFKTYCTPCHGQLGEGGIGPNLTDKFWLHGHEPLNIVQTITVGVVEKGMTPWKGILSASQIKEVAAYVITLEGSNPPNAKAPQGEEKKRGS